MIYDLEERTTKFSQAVISCCNSYRYSVVSSPLINQLIRSATSIGANYAEANSGASKKDFRNKIYICKKEAQETKYWINLLAGISTDDQKVILRPLWQEASELTLILGRIIQSLKIKN